jgi:hypothetical protein
MQSALSYYSSLAAEGKLNRSLVFIGPKSEIADFIIKKISDISSRSITRKTASASKNFWPHIIAQSQQTTLFSQPEILCIEGCSEKLIEGALDHLNQLRQPILCQAPKMSYKAPSIAKLEKNGNFLFLTTFEPRTNELHRFAELYLGTHHQSLIHLAECALPFDEFVSELDQFKLLGPDHYKLPKRHLRFDELCFEILSQKSTAAHFLHHALTIEDIDAEAFVRALTMHLTRLSSLKTTSNTITFNNALQIKYKLLLPTWNNAKIHAGLCHLYECSHQMRQNQVNPNLVCEQAIFSYFLSKN